MTYTLDALAPDRHTWALRVATDPAFAPFPEERARAWAMLKEDAGQTHRIWRLTTPSGGTLADTIDSIRSRGLARRIRAHAARIGQGPDGAA